MILNKGQKYILKKPLTLRTPFSIGTLSIGTEIEIQQVDIDYNKYLVENVWLYYRTVEDVIIYNLKGDE